MPDVQWESEDPKLIYTRQPRALDLHGINFPTPSSLPSRLALRWLFGPYMLEHLALSDPPLFLSPKNPNRHDRGVMSTGLYKTWYSMHISADLRLKYIAPLSSEQLERIRQPLDELMENQQLEELKFSASKMDLLFASLKSSPLNRATSPISDEPRLQTKVFQIVEPLIHIISSLFTRSHIDAPSANDQDICHTIGISHNSGANQATITNPYVLRTSTKPQTGLTSDFIIYLPYDPPPNFFHDEDRNRYVVHRDLVKPGKIVFLGIEVKVDLHLERPLLKVKYPRIGCNKQHPNETDCKYHHYDIHRPFEDNSPERADFQLDRIQALEDLLGDDPSPEAEELPTSTLSHDIEQLWAQMVSQGTYVAFLVDWLHRNYLCIRNPKTGTLYMSENLPNPLVGTTYGERESCLPKVTAKMNDKKYPWAPGPDRRTLIYTIGAAVLTAFNLLQPDLPDPLFIPMDTVPHGLWEEATREMVTRRKKRNTEAINFSLEEIAALGRENQDTDRPPGPSSGDGSNPGGAFFQGDDPMNQGDQSSNTNDPSANQQGFGSQGDSPSGHTRARGNGDMTPEVIHVGIFDGELYCSDQLDVFYNMENRHICGHHSSNTGNGKTTASSSWTRYSDGSSVASTCGTTPRPPSPFGRSFTSTSSKSDLSTPCQSPKSLFPTGMDLSSIEESPLDAEKRDATQINTNAMRDVSKSGHGKAFVFLNNFVVEGAVGDVWEGYAKLPNQSEPVHIAAKLAFSPQAMDSLEHECHIYQHLGSDPGLPVPTMYGYFQNTDDKVGQQVGLLLLLWVDGIVPQCRQDVLEARPLIVDALARLHRCGVVHGDIAPRNILINEGKVTLIDFDRAVIHRQSLEVDLQQLEDMCE